MNRRLVFVFALAMFSKVAGYFLSVISLVGKIGIGLFYREYGFLKTWWKGALLVFIIWIFLYVVQILVQKNVGKSTIRSVFFISVSIAFAGICFTYADFRNSLSHRWLGEPFHLGVYLFWLGWVVIPVFLQLTKTKLDEEDGLREL